MKKNEDKGESPDEKKLIWKFKDLPTADEVSKLVDTKVITPEEARAILFREEVKQSDELDALREMVNVLQEMVKDLLSRPNNVQFVPYTKVIKVPAWSTPYWNKYWADGKTFLGTTTNTVTTTGSSGNTAYTLSVK